MSGSKPLEVSPRLFWFDRHNTAIATACIVGCLLSLLFAAGCAHPMLHADMAAHVADNVSTQLAVSPANGVHEANVFLPDNHWGNASLQLVGTAAEYWLLRKLEPSHPKLARTLEAIGIGIGVTDTAINVRVARRVR